MLLWGSILEIEIRPRHAHEREHPFTQMVVAQHVHSSLLVAPWNLCVDRPVHNNSWQCERVNPHAWWKNNTRPDTADCGVWNKHTQRGRIWSCGSKGWNSPSNETWQPWQSSGWCVRIFPIKKSRTSIWTSPGNAKLPWWFSSSWFPPQRYWRGVLHYLHPALINCLLCYPFIFIDDIPIFTGSYAPFYPSNHAILVVWVYVKRSNPRWRCRSGSLCTICCG